MLFVPQNWDLKPWSKDQNIANLSAMLVKILKVFCWRAQGVGEHGWATGLANCLLPLSQDSVTSVGKVTSLCIETQVHWNSGTLSLVGSLDWFEALCSWERGWVFPGTPVFFPHQKLTLRIYMTSTCTMSLRLEWIGLYTPLPSFFPASWEKECSEITTELSIDLVLAVYDKWCHYFGKSQKNVTWNMQLCIY